MATKQLQSSNFQELLLQDDQGDTLLRFASAYIFRNIQLLMRNNKGGKCEYGMTMWGLLHVLRVV